MSLARRTGPNISNHLPENWCRALGWVTVGGRRLPLLPKEVAPLLLVPVVLLLLVLIVLELRLAQMERAGVLTSADWIAEDRLINELNTLKIRQRGRERRWFSEGMPWPAATDGRTRIMVVGDSFAWGSGNLNANDIWWRQLARELQRRDYWGVDVVALGASGASTEDQLRWLRDEGWLERVKPDLVVFGYVTNDPAVRDSNGFLVKQLGGDVPYPEWRGLDRTIGTVLPRLTDQLKARLTTKWESEVTDAFPYAEWELKILEEPNVSRYAAVLEELGRYMRSSSVPHAFFTLPNSPTPDYFEPRLTPVRPLFDAAGIEFVDLLPRFVERFGPSDRAISWGVNPANGHPGPISTQFYATEVATWIERHQPAALGLKGPMPANREPIINDWTPPQMRVSRESKQVWSLKLPTESARAPTLPLERAHGHLAFEHPVALRQVQLEADIDEAELFYTTVDPATQVESPPLSAGMRPRGSLTWNLPKERINTLRIAIRSSTTDAEGLVRSQLSLSFDSPAVRP